MATRKLRYDEVIADGDSKTIAKLNEAKVHGEVVIEKHERVGHIQKQVGNRGNTAERDFLRDKTVLQLLSIFAWASLFTACTVHY